MTKPSQIGTREQILDTALELFRTKGYDATSLRELASRLEITKAALYYHFPAKELLLLELTRPLLDGMSRLVTELRDTEPCDPSVLLSSYLDLFAKHTEVIGLLASEPATQHHPDIGQRARTLVTALQQLLAGPDPSPERAVRSACAIGVIHSVPLLPAGAIDDQRATILAVALAALDEHHSPHAASNRPVEPGFGDANY